MEPLLLVLSIYFFVMLAFGRFFLRKWRDRRRERRVVRLANTLIGQEISSVKDHFGEPFSVIPGSGRTLYEWKSPPSSTFPSGSGLLIFYVVTDDRGRVTHTSWQTRSEEVWRSGARSASSGG